MRNISDGVVKQIRELNPTVIQIKDRAHNFFNNHKLPAVALLALTENTRSFKDGVDLSFTGINCIAALIGGVAGFIAGKNIPNSVEKVAYLAGEGLLAIGLFHIVGQYDLTFAQTLFSLFIGGLVGTAGSYFFPAPVKD